MAGLGFMENLCLALSMVARWMSSNVVLRDLRRFQASWCGYGQQGSVHIGITWQESYFGSTKASSPHRGIHDENKAFKN